MTYLGKGQYLFKIYPARLAEKNIVDLDLGNSFFVLIFCYILLFRSFWKWKINSGSLNLALQKHKCITADALTPCLTLSDNISLWKILFETTVLVSTVYSVFFLKLLFLLHLIRPTREVNCLLLLYIWYCIILEIDLPVQFWIISNLKWILWKYGLYY